MTPGSNDNATNYLLNWMKTVMQERINNPEAFIDREPGLYIGGLKVRESDTIVTDNHGLPQIVRAGCCQ